MSQRLLDKAAPDSLHVVVVMCDFSDSLLYGRYGQIEGDFPPPRQSDFYYDRHDSLYFHHLLTDVAAYFAGVSDGQFKLKFEVVGTVANLPNPMSFYGNHPDEGEQSLVMAEHTVTMLDPLVDFSRFDTVLLVHAGAGEETDILNDSPEQIYSTYLGPDDFVSAVEESLLTTPYLETDDFDEGSGIDQVLILPETEFQDPFGSFKGYFGSLGVYCFEVGLRLGMLSLSDFTPAGRVDSQGIGEFGLMGYGLFVGAGFIPAHPCVFNKMLMGWLDPYPVSPDSGTSHALTPAEFANSPTAAARVDITGQEYWLLEYRLQDPDGNVKFSWDGDLNGDGVPNFYDVDSDSGDGTPTGFFDPLGPDQLPDTGDEDRREWLDGAEFDFFMSENSARAANVKGAGSGIYIWHIDEGVIQDAFGAASNLFNADPARKAVDLEEADGIQDLDSRIGSPYILGGDDDSFRGEGTDMYGPDQLIGTRFGPETVPSTESAGGAWTGIVFDSFSDVVADSATGSPAVIDYAEAMIFRCGRQGAVAGLPQLAAERELSSVDLRGSHLLACDLDDPADGRLEIICAGDLGRLFAFESDLSDHQSGPLAMATDSEGRPVTWNGPAAAGDIDGDGLPEIVLTAPNGLYAFNGEDGTEVLDGDGDPVSHGLLAACGDSEVCHLPPVLLPLDIPPGPYLASFPVAVCIVIGDSLAESPHSVLRFLQVQDGQLVAAADELQLLGNSYIAAPVRVHDTLFLATEGEGDSSCAPSLELVSFAPWQSSPALLETIPLSIVPGPLTPHGGYGTCYYLVVPGVDGVETCYWGGAPFSAELAQHVVWPASMEVLSPPAADFSFVGDGIFGRATLAGVPATGWPVRPQPTVRAASAATAPSTLNVRLGDDSVTLFQSRDGRLYLYSESGVLQAGYPLAGPGLTAGTPLLHDLDGDGNLELVALGTTDKIVGINDTADSLETETTSRLAVWSGVGNSSEIGNWNMWRGNPWRTGESAERVILVPPPPAPPLALENHICYPSPLTSGPLHVRAIPTRDGQAQATIYNLEGEEVVSASLETVLRDMPFELLLPLERVASGLYVCRLQVDAREGGTMTSVKSFAIAR
ncbi:MAG: VCBS repeat-containing protein [bacterium]